MIGELLLQWLNEHPIWKEKEGLEVVPTILYQELKAKATAANYDLKQIRFPGSPTWLGHRLNTLKHSLDEYGIRFRVDSSKTSNKYTFNCSTSSIATPSNDKTGGAIRGATKNQQMIALPVEQPPNTQKIAPPIASLQILDDRGAIGAIGAIQGELGGKVLTHCSQCGTYAICQLDKGTGERFCTSCAKIEVFP